MFALKCEHVDFCKIS